MLRLLENLILIEHFGMMRSLSNALKRIESVVILLNTAFFVEVFKAKESHLYF